MPWCNKAKTKQKYKWICCNFAVVFSNLSLVLLWFLSNTHAVSHQWSCSKPFWVEPVTEFICYVNILLIDWKWQIIDWKCHWELLVFVLLHPFFDVFFLLWKIQKSFIVLKHRNRGYCALKHRNGVHDLYFSIHSKKNPFKNLNFVT